MTFLIIAFYLTILTFYLGVLIYALPIPVAGLKRWGPRLINDAFFTAVIASCIELILNFADYLGQILGSNWGTFFSTVKGLLIFRSTTIIIVSSISSAISKVIPGVSKVVSAGLNILTTSLYFLALMYFLGLLIYFGVVTLSSFGIALMAVPFRIARNAGSFLLSFAIVFYIGLPLYPQFSIILSSPLPRSSLDLAIVYGNVQNFLGHSIADGYIGIKVRDEYVGPAKLEPGGRAVILIPKKYMGEYATIYFDVAGHRFYTNISDTILSSVCVKRFHEHICEVNIEVKGLLHYSNGLAIHIHPPPDKVEDINMNNSHILITMQTDVETTLYISAVNMYSITRVYIDSTSLGNLDKYKAYEWIWYNVQGATYTIPIPSGYHTICIEYSLKSSENLEPSTEDLYPGKILQQDIPLNQFVDYLAATIYLEITSSIIFISLLLSATYGLSRLLGGTRRLRLIP